MRQYILLGVICEFILALFVKTARWAVPIIALGLIQAEVVQAFSIYNDTSGDVTVTLEDANLPAGEFSLDHPGQLADPADLPPDQLQHEGDHHHQPQCAFSQA